MADRELSITIKTRADGTELGKVKRAYDEFAAAIRKPLGKIDTFAQLSRGAQEAERAFKEAQTKVADLARKMRESGEPTKALTREFEASRRAAGAAKDQYEASQLKLHKLRQELTAAGINTRNLASEKIRLAGELQKVGVQYQIAAAKAEELDRRARFFATNNGAGRMKKDLEGIAPAGDRAAAAIAKIGHYATGLLGLNLGASLARDIINIADSWTLAGARIQVAAGNSEAAKAAQSGLLEIAKATATEFDAVATLFSRTNQSVIAAGNSQRDTLRLVTIVAQAARVSGASAQEGTASVRQLSQALASGVLRGDEFNSVMENSPRLAKALADGLGVPIGALRQMAEDGKLTADIVINALLGQADKIAEEFGRIPLTVGAATQNLKTAFGAYINEANNANGATASLAGHINNLANHLPAVAETLKQVTAIAAPVTAIAAAYFVKLAGSVDLATLAFGRFVPALVAAFALNNVLKLLTAFNEEQLRQEKNLTEARGLRLQAEVMAKFANIQLLSFERYQALDKASQEFYRKDLERALEAAELKRKLALQEFTRDNPAGETDTEERRRLEQEAIAATRNARLIREALASITAADGKRADAMKLHSENVVKAKELELKRLQAVFEAQKQGLKEAEEAFAAAKKKRQDILKVFQDIQKNLTAGKNDQPILGYQVQNAVNDALKVQELAAKAPASEAGKLADEAIEKARTAADLLKRYKEQQDATGSSIDAAEAQRVAEQLSGQLLNIVDQATAIQEKLAQSQVETIQKLIQDTLNQAEALKHLEIGFDKDAAARSLDEVIALAREKAQQSPIKIPAVIVTGSLPDKLPGVEEIDKKAVGGPILGNGPKGVDSKLIMAAPGEHMLTADEVDAAGGHAAIYRMRRLLRAGLLPRFDIGGAVGASREMRSALSRLAIPTLPSPAASGASGLHRGTFILPSGDQVAFAAAPDAFDTLERNFMRESLAFGKRR